MPQDLTRRIEESVERAEAEAAAAEKEAERLLKDKEAQIERHKQARPLQLSNAPF